MNNATLYLITVLIWGSTWLAIEFQLGVVPTEVSVVYRYTLASALLFAWCLARGRRLRFSWREHLRLAALGFLLFGLSYLIGYRAQTHITGAMTAIAYSMMLWMNLVNARLFFGVVPERRTLVGAAVGIIGLTVSFAPQVRSFSLHDETLTGLLLVLLGALSASFGNMVSQGAQRSGLPVVQSNAWGMAYGALTAAVCALLQGRSFVVDGSPAYLLSLGYLALFGSVAGFGAYLTLLGRIGAGRAGYATVAFPVVALVLGVLFEGVELRPSMVLGMVLVLAGNVLVLRRASGSGRQKGGTEGGGDTSQAVRRRWRPWRVKTAQAGSA